MSEEQVMQQLNSAMSQLRSEINSAFHDAPVTNSMQHKPSVLPEPAEKAPVHEESDRIIKLTEYLLYLKERQLNEELEHSKTLHNAVVTLSAALSAKYDGRLSLEWMLSEFTHMVNASSAVLWAQRGEKYSISTAHIGIEEGEELFRSLLGSIVDVDLRDPRITMNGTHFLFLTHLLKRDGLSVVRVLVFIRDSSNAPFSPEDAEIATALSEVIFKASIQAGEL